MDYQSPTPIIKRVGIYLNNAMPLSRSKLIDHLQGLEATRKELAEAVVDWHLKVAKSKNQMLHPKDKDLTELDRTVMLEAHISVIRRDYEFLVKLEELVKDRIELAKVMLPMLK